MYEFGANRTNVGLKLARASAYYWLGKCANRTNVGLKPSIEVSNFYNRVRC